MSTPPPDVTVVVPTRNRRRLLGRTLHSVLAQQCVEVQVVVVDDGSDDGTEATFAAIDHPRVTVLRNDRSGGVSAARNLGTADATTRWVAWCDDDDRWGPTKLRDQLDALAATPDARWAATSAVIVDVHDEVIGVQRGRVAGDVADALLERNFVPGGGSGVVAERTLVDEVGGFDASFSLLADWDLWTRFALAAPAVHVDRPDVAYLRHNGAMTRRLDQLDVELDRLRAKYADERRARGVEMDDEQMLRWATRQHVRSGRRVAAIRGYLRLAAEHRRLYGVAKAASVFVAPQIARRRDLQPIVPDPAWAELAAAWICDPGNLFDTPAPRPTDA